MRKLGPYFRKDGRAHMIVINDDGTKTTQSYPRHLMEEKLGRKLEPWEHVDHIDDDKTNNDIDNFQILTLAENSKKAMRLRAAEPPYVFVCPCCRVTVSKPAKDVRANRKKGKSGPYCSKSCAGKTVSHGIGKVHQVQMPDGEGFA